MGLVELVKSCLYTRRVLGKNGYPFDMIKIRTMVQGADQHLDSVLVNGVDETGHICADPRVTSYGRVLRRYFLDEVPQLLHILQGHMGLVGIRPGSSNEWLMYPASLQQEALKYKPGLLGIQYAVPVQSFPDGVEAVRTYLVKKAEAPFLTDVKYGLRILYNILFRGRRSV